MQGSAIIYSSPTPKAFPSLIRHYSFAIVAKQPTMLNGKDILITGGTGSLGKALTQRILRDYPDVNLLIHFVHFSLKKAKPPPCSAFLVPTSASPTSLFGPLFRRDQWR